MKTFTIVFGQNFSKVFSKTRQIAPFIKKLLYYSRLMSMSGSKS